MRRLFERKPPPAAVAPAPSFEEQLRERIREVNAKWQEALRIATAQAYTTGHAAGELAGRQALALELQVAHGTVDGGEKPMTPDELETLAKSQVH